MNKFQSILKSKKGFTLMELIVVLIILAVLVAALIPTFIGFADRAASATAIADAGLGMTAAQAVVTQAVASGQATAADAVADMISADATPDADDDWGLLFAQFLAQDGLNPSQFPDIRLGPAPQTNRIIGLDYLEGNGGFNVRIQDGNTVAQREALPTLTP